MKNLFSKHHTQHPHQWFHLIITKHCKWGVLGRVPRTLKTEICMPGLWWEQKEEEEFWYKHLRGSKSDRTRQRQVRLGRQRGDAATTEAPAHPRELWTLLPQLKMTRPSHFWHWHCFNPGSGHDLELGSSLMLMAISREGLSSQHSQQLREWRLTLKSWGPGGGRRASPATTRLLLCMF